MTPQSCVDALESVEAVLQRMGEINEVAWSEWRGEVDPTPEAIMERLREETRELERLNRLFEVDVDRYQVARDQCLP